MANKIAMAVAVAVILFLPETNRFDLATVMLLGYACAFYLVRHIAGAHSRFHAERERVNRIRWIRRNPPKTPSLKGIRDGMVYYAPNGTVWFDWMPAKKEMP